MAPKRLASAGVIKPSASWAASCVVLDGRSVSHRAVVNTPLQEGKQNTAMIRIMNTRKRRWRFPCCLFSVHLSGCNRGVLADGVEAEFWQAAVNLGVRLSGIGAQFFYSLAGWPWAHGETWILSRTNEEGWDQCHKQRGLLKLWLSWSAYLQKKMDLFSDRP